MSRSSSVNNSSWVPVALGAGAVGFFVGRYFAPSELDLRTRWSNRPAIADLLGGFYRVFIRSRLTSRRGPADKPADTTIPENANASCVGPDSEKAGKASGCAGCPNQNICATGKLQEGGSAGGGSGSAGGAKPAENDAAVLVSEKLKNVRRKILVLSGKGGVGKSTVCAQLARYLAAGEEEGGEKKQDVGVLDIDITGPSVPTMFSLVGEEVRQTAAGWEPVVVQENLSVMSIGFMTKKQDDAIIWRGPRKNGLIRQFLTDVNWGGLDWLFVDTPPGTSDEHLSILGYLSQAGIDGAVIVTTPSEVALSDVRKEINFCKKTGIPILGLVENMSGMLGMSGDAVKRMCAEYGVAHLGKVPHSREMLDTAEGKLLRKDDGGMEGGWAATGRVVDAMVRSLEEFDRKEADRKEAEATGAEGGLSLESTKEQ